MAILSGKLAGIILPIDYFGVHLDSQGKVIDLKLAAQNFHYSGEALCEIWRPKNCKRVWFDNITIEEMLEGFIGYSNDLASEYSEIELELKNEELETKVEEFDDEHQMFEIVLKYDVVMEKLLD
ncbi:13128_t:CDS:2 [Funneliformis geosporum]|uniref:13128_t:CDS:1 n=1 Tax=Funneliformis geosporum TaxID=1117311 RepID=A0A9W4X6W0_9GLOM|nr:13128_t:CDS:2 [Funneliformis geosporum]